MLPKVTDAGLYPLAWVWSGADRSVPIENGVVEPDIEDAGGRGTSRRFSDRNLLKFAGALCLRGLELPAALAAAIVRVLRSFELGVARQITGFQLPDRLRAEDRSIFAWSMQPIDYSLDEALGQGALTATLRLGADPAWCVGFEGVAVLKDTSTADGKPGVFKGRNALAPVSCPLP